jgi:hypothetical protein
VGRRGDKAWGGGVEAKGRAEGRTAPARRRRQPAHHTAAARRRCTCIPHRVTPRRLEWRSEGVEDGRRGEGAEGKSEGAAVNTDITLNVLKAKRKWKTPSTHRDNTGITQSRRARFRLRVDVGGETPVQNQLVAQLTDGLDLLLTLIHAAPHPTFRWKRITRQAPEHSTVP